MIDDLGDVVCAVIEGVCELVMWPFSWGSTISEPTYSKDYKKKKEQPDEET